MDVTKLMIGNYLHGYYEDDKFDVCRVMALDTTGMAEYEIWVESEKSDTEVYDYFRGIEIDEKWLFKFGFEKSDVNAGIESWSNHSISIATYSKSKVDYFITCDDQIIKTYKKNRDVFKVPIVGMREFISVEGK